eukprot:RCo036413
MFWKLAFHTTKTAFEALLDKEDLSLEELLDQEDVVQEVKSGNAKLISFLTKGKCVGKLLEFTTVPVPAEESATSDEKRRFKFPYVACELLVADVPALFDSVVESEDHMNQLFSFLQQPSPLPQTLSLYFVRVLQALYAKKPAEVAEYITKKDGSLALDFVKHIETFGMNELILTLLGTMDEEDRMNGGALASWWMQHNLLSVLLERLVTAESSDIHVNIIRMLCEVVRRFHNPNITAFAELIMSVDTVERLLTLMMNDLAVNQKSVLFSEGTNLLISVIDSLVRREEMARTLSQESAESTAEVTASSSPPRDADAEEHQIDRTIGAILARSEELVRFLRDPGPLESIELSWTTLSPPLGLSRLKTVELLLVLLKTKKRHVEDTLIALNVLPTCVGLMFTFDMNNLLHILVDEMVISALVSGNPALVACLFQGCNLLERILDAVSDDRPAPQATSEPPSSMDSPVKAPEMEPESTIQEAPDQSGSTAESSSPVVPEGDCGMATACSASGHESSAPPEVAETPSCAESSGPLADTAALTALNASNLSESSSDAPSPPAPHPPRPPARLRKGYFGHITSISNKIVQAEELQPLVREYTAGNHRWGEYVATHLAARNAIDTVMLGGVPPPAVSSSLPSDPLGGEEGVALSEPRPCWEELAASQPEESRAESSLKKYCVDEKAEESSSPPETFTFDADFDAREVVHPEQEEITEEVWQECQIVDRSADLADANDSWARFDNAPGSRPLDHGGGEDRGAAKPRPLGFYYDSSSDDDDVAEPVGTRPDEGDVFVPSPTVEGKAENKHRAARGGGAAASALPAAPAPSADVDSDCEDEGWSHVDGPGHGAPSSDLAAISTLANSSGLESGANAETPAARAEERAGCSSSPSTTSGCRAEVRSTATLPNCCGVSPCGKGSSAAPKAADAQPPNGENSDFSDVCCWDGDCEVKAVR